MGVLEFIATLVGHLAWPAIALVFIGVFYKPVGEFIQRSRKAHISKDGLLLEADAREYLQVAKSEASPTVVTHVQLRSVVEKGVNANGAYTVYANKTIVARKSVSIKAGTTSLGVSLPIAMVNEILTVQFLGDVVGKVIATGKYHLDLKVDLSTVDRDIEIVVTGI